MARLPTTRTWFITGCSSGFGRILARMALEQGDNVVATARDPGGLAELGTDFPDRLLALPLDVTRPDAAAGAMGQARARFGGVDILVNNAGFGFVGAIEEAEPAEYRPVFETNLFGLIETTRAALPLLRRSGRGRIVNLSSVGGITGRQGFGYYNASKFAVEGLSEALSEELAPFGIRVIIVEPGAFRTEFLGRSIKAAKQRLPEYEATSGATRDFSAANHGVQLGDPVKGMAVLMEAILAEDPPLRLPLGRDAIARIEAKVARLSHELDDWRGRAMATGAERDG